MTFARTIRSRASQFRAASDGAVAIEFVFVLPILVMLYFGAFEGSKLYEASRKINTATETIGDLVGRVRTVSANELDRTVDIARAIMYPFAIDTLNVRISAIEQDADGEWAVAWSRQDGGAGLASGTPYPIPDQLNTNGNGFFVVVDTEYTYQSPIVHSVIASSLALEHQFAIIPRVSSKISCEDC